MAYPRIYSQLQSVQNVTQSNSLVFIDSGIEDYEVLVNGITDRVEVIVLEGADDLLYQIPKAKISKTKLPR